MIRDRNFWNDYGRLRKRVDETTLHRNSAPCHREGHDGIVVLTAEVGVVRSYDRLSGDVEHKEDRAVVRPAPIAADNVLVAGFRRRSDRERGSFSHVKENTALPVDE